MSSSKPKLQCYTLKRKDDTNYTTCNDDAQPKAKKKIKFVMKKKKEEPPKKKIKFVVKQPKLISDERMARMRRLVGFLGRKELATKKLTMTKIRMYVKSLRPKKTDDPSTLLSKALLSYANQVNTPSNFVCYRGMSLYMYLEVLRRNKNDCIFGLKAGATQNSDVIYDYYSNTATSGITLEELRNPEVKERLLAKYESCTKNGKILCVPIFKKGHANMLVFNYHLKQIEYYEPHGTGTKPFENAVKKLANYFNNNGDANIMPGGVTAISSAETCPKFSKETLKIFNDNQILLRSQSQGMGDTEESGLQMFDDPTGTQNKKGVEPNGYCCMWSFLYMDYRLKNPTLPANELSNQLIKLAEKNPKTFFRNYIRGYTNDLLENLIDKIGIARLRSVNHDKGRNNNEQRKFLSALILPTIKKMWKEAVGNQ